MSMEFTTILAAAPQRLDDLALRFRARFQALDWRSGQLIRVALDTERDVFDELYPEEYVSIDDPNFGIRVAAWQGWSNEYYTDGVTLYVLVGLASTHVNVMVDVSTRTLERLIAEDELNKYVSGLLAAADASRATVGYGHYLLYFEPTTPEQAKQAISSLPEYPGESASLGLLSSREYSLERAKTEYGEKFYLSISLTGHILLLDKELTT